MKKDREKRIKLFGEWFDRILNGDLPVGEEWIKDRIFFHFKDGQQINFTKEEFSVIIPQIKDFLNSFDFLLDEEEE